MIGRKKKKKTYLLEYVEGLGWRLDGDPVPESYVVRVYLNAGYSQAVATIAAYHPETVL